MKGTAGGMIDDGGQASVRTSNLREWEMKESENSLDLFGSAVKVSQYVNYFIYHLLVVPQTIPTELVYI